MGATANALGTVNVCQDCYYCHAYGCDDSECGHLAMIGDQVTVTSGCLDCERCECCDMPVCDCLNYGNGSHGFSWRECDGCGSPLGGDRYPLVIWEDYP